MKKIITMLMCVALLLSSCSSLCACSSYDSENAVKNSENPIEFGKKYMVGKNNYYVFNHDGTGTFYRKYVYEYEPDSKYNYTLSGSVDFVWREASDGAIYLFEREVHYNEDHTEGKSLTMTEYPIYFSEDFFTYTYHPSTGSTQTVKYIKEGSELESILNK